MQYLNPIYVIYSLTWAQNLNAIKKLFVLEKEALRIIYFQNHNAHTCISSIQNMWSNCSWKCLFMYKYFDFFLPKILQSWLTLIGFSYIRNLLVQCRRPCCTLNYMEETQSTVCTWNYLQKLNEKIFKINSHQVSLRLLENSI